MTFDELYDKYRHTETPLRQSFDKLAKQYVEGRNKTFYEAAACSAAIAGLNLESGFNPDSLSPELSESFRLAFPNLNINDVANYSGDQLEGLLQPWKGKLFEVSVRDRLNAGEWVGDYQLQTGQHAELATSATQPGWDLQIVNSDGSIAELVQLKATNYINYVESALAKYPQYDVLATSELSSHVDSIEGLSVSDISDGGLEGQLSNAVAGDDYGLLGLGLPLLPLALNVFWVAKGERTVGEAATAVAISTAAIAGGQALGDIASDVLGDMVGDAVMDGIGSVLLDGLFGFGIFTGLRLLFGGDSKAEKRAAKAKAESIRLEKLAIDSTCRHIDETVEACNLSLDRMTKHYLIAPNGSR